MFIGRVLDVVARMLKILTRTSDGAATGASCDTECDRESDNDKTSVHYDNGVFG
jgi:hypothetical protein